MIYDSAKGARGKVFSNGVEVDRCIMSVNTETGEVVCSVEPMRVENGEVVNETLVLENVTFEPL